MTGPLLVYFIKPIGLDGPIKIGCSGVPADRLETLSIWSPWPLEVIGSVSGTLHDERFLHQCFADTHSHREWFHSSPALSDTIARIVAAGTIDAVRPIIFPKGDIRKRRARAPWPFDRRQHRSLACKVLWAQKRLRRNGDGTAWQAPDDVAKIISNWGSTWYRGGAGRAILPRELARIEEYLADPAPHSIVPSWYRRPASPPPEKVEAAS